MNGCSHDHKAKQLHIHVSRTNELFVFAMIEEIMGKWVMKAELPC